MFDVVGLGLNAMDTICIVDALPAPGSKIPIRTLRVEPGGQVATALSACSRLGLRARYIGSVGNDSWGRAQVESLRAEGVDVEYVRAVEGAATQTAVILIESSVGERTILWNRDPNLNYPLPELNKEIVTNARVLHLDGCDSVAALQAARWARSAGIPVVIDIDEFYDDSTHELLRNVDYLIAAEEFPRTIVDADSAEDGARALASRYGCRVVGITLGSRGAVFCNQGEILHTNAFKVRVADTTGAGDAFHGGFIYGLIQGWALESIAQFAHATAALQCMHIGARTGLPTLNQVKDFLRSA